MRPHRFIPVFLLLGLVSCKPVEQEPVYEPTVRLELQEVSAYRATFSVKTIDAASVVYGVGASETPELEHEIPTGSIKPSDLSFSVGDLSPGTDYRIRLRGVGPGGEEGNIQTLDFRTLNGPAQLYAWERARTSRPSFADISLITLGKHNYNPPVWTKDRFASHVQYTDQNGKSHWLFESFLCIDGFDGDRGLSYCIANGRQSAIRESWEDLLEAWLGDDGALRKLDEAITDAVAVLGTPARPHYIVMSLPDPIRFQFFDDKTSSTTYWGELDGRRLDFSRVEDQQAAYRWYADRCRSRFNILNFKNLELAGFYILSEELPLSPDFFQKCGKPFDSADTWNWQYKRWEQLVPWVSDYAHSCNEGLWWIPYHLAPGYRVWEELGFDAAFMQPNRYWDNSSNQHPMNKTVDAIKRYRLGMELEFEYSMVADVMKDGRAGPDGSGNPAFHIKDVPMLRDRLREYFAGYKESGLYGVIPLAVYSGTDAFHQLAISQENDDIAMYHELCRFIIDSPLRTTH